MRCIYFVNNIVEFVSAVSLIGILAVLALADPIGEVAACKKKKGLNFGIVLPTTSSKLVLFSLYDAY